MPHDPTNKVSCTNYQCEIEVALEILGGKWKALILWQLGQQGTIRYNEFMTLMPTISQKMLTQQLRFLEKHLLVERTIYSQVPPMVEYSLTPLGKEVLPILEQLDLWGKKMVQKFPT